MNAPIGQELPRDIIISSRQIQKNKKQKQECGEKETPIGVGGTVNWCSHYEKQYKNSSKN